MSAIFEYAAEEHGFFDQGTFPFRDRNRFRWTTSQRNAPFSTCTYCKSKMDLAAQEGRPASNFFNRALLCGVCGWWNVEQNGVGKVDDGVGFFSCRRVTGILRRYSVSDPGVPIDLLRAEVARRPKLAYESDARVWERLVGDVLSEVRKCEVVHVGRSADGGVDLLLVNGDKPAAVQVKRRQRPGGVERVQLVREFLGATLLAGYRSGVLVTTADRYTQPARKAAERAEATGLTDRFELVDFPSFVSLMRESAPAIERWRSYISTMWFRPEQIKPHQVLEDGSTVPLPLPPNVIATPIPPKRSGRSKAKVDARGRKSSKRIT